MGANARKIVLGTRGSQLALIQAKYVRQRLRELDSYPIDIKVIQTQGDRQATVPFSQMPGQGFFTKELERALLAGEIDLAVHSYKDLQTTLPDGLCIAAVPQREDRRDMILTRSNHNDPTELWGVPHAAVVGSSSTRRTAQLLQYRPDVHIKLLRGNIPTRIQKLKDGEYDAIVLAVAGVMRLGLTLEDLRAVEIDERLFVPAPAQGALAVETRSNDLEMNELLHRIDDPALREIVEAERMVLKNIGGGCRLPLGVVATRRGASFAVSAFLGPTEDSSFARRVTMVTPHAGMTVNAITAALTRPVCQNRSFVFHNKKFVITRAADQVTKIDNAIAAAGGKLLCYPTLRVVEAGDAALQKRAISTLGQYHWVLFSSGNGIRLFSRLLEQVRPTRDAVFNAAVMGPGSAAVFKEIFSRPADFIASVSTGKDFAREFAKKHGISGMKLLLPTSVERRGELEHIFDEAGFIVEPLVVYDTVRSKAVSEWDGTADAVVFTSPKAAQYLLEMAQIPSNACLVSIGPSTTDYLIGRDLFPVIEAFTHELDGILEALYVHFG